MGTGPQALCELLDTNECTYSTTTEPLPSATRTKQETNRIGPTAEFGSSPASLHFTNKTGIRLSRGIFFNVGSQNSDLKQTRGTHFYPRFPDARFGIHELCLRSGNR